MNLGNLRKILVTLGQILSYAVRHKYLEHNPLKEAERPRDQAQLNGDEEGCGQDTKILTPAQINAFLAQVIEPKYRTLFMLAVFSGARQGELLGLRWDDVDWHRGQLAIQRSFNNGRLFNPKTQTSKRKIDLGPMVMKELKKWRLACPKNGLNWFSRMGPGTILTTRICCGGIFDRRSKPEAVLPFDFTISAILTPACLSPKGRISNVSRISLAMPAPPSP